MVRPIAEGRAAEPVQRAADELYGLPLPDFTKARDEHARRLREEGLRDEAEAKCQLKLWGACEASLDEAQRIDAAGEGEERVQRLRNRWYV